MFEVVKCINFLAYSDYLRVKFYRLFSNNPTICNIVKYGLTQIYDFQSVKW